MADRKFALPQTPQIDSRLVQLPTEIHFCIFRHLLLFTDIHIIKKLEKIATHERVFKQYTKNDVYHSRWKDSKLYNQEYRPAKLALRAEREKFNRETTARIRDGLNLAAACQILYETGSNVFYCENELEIALGSKGLRYHRFTALLDNLRWVSLRSLECLNPGEATIENSFNVHTPADMRKYSRYDIRELPINKQKVAMASATVRRFQKIRVFIFWTGMSGELDIHLIVRLFREVLRGKHIDIDRQYHGGGGLLRSAESSFEPCRILRCSSLRIDGKRPPENIQKQILGIDPVRNTYSEWTALQRVLLKNLPQFYFRWTRLNGACRRRMDWFTQAVIHYDSKAYASGLTILLDDMLKWSSKTKERCRFMVDLAGELQALISHPILDKFCEDIGDLFGGSFARGGAVEYRRRLAGGPLEQWKEWEDENNNCYAEDIFGPQRRN